MQRALWAAMAIAVLLVGNAPPIYGDGDATCTARTGGDVHWLRVSPERERRSIDRWCAGVGPPARISVGQRSENPAGSLVVVSWNTHVGAGDIDALVGDLRSGRLGGAPPAPFVVLMQEAYRAGADVPSRTDVSWASAEGAAKGDRVDVAAAAQRLGLSSIYVPSMRNGRPGETQADRGNAILSSLPFDEVTAIELPLERQRRVAIQATVSLNTASGIVPLRVVSTHFTNMVMHHLWLLSESGRMRQARALARVLPAEGPLVVGGDFNAWFGYRDAAYRELRERARPADVEDRRATFGPLRLDHILFRLPAGWQTTLRRGESRYGSDHYPLVSVIHLP